MLRSLLLYVVVFIVPAAVILGSTLVWIARQEKTASTEAGKALGVVFLYLAGVSVAAIVGVIAVLGTAIARGQFVLGLLTVLVIGTVCVGDWFLSSAMTARRQEKLLRQFWQNAEATKRQRPQGQ